MSDGLVVASSRLSFAETLERLCAALERNGVEIFARIDHAANAATAGLGLRPTTVLVFGAAKAGTPLMAARQTLGLDLPLRALVFEDAEGETRVAYNDPAWIVSRQGLDAAAFPSVAGMAKLLAAVTAEAAGAPAGG
ncbi:MAG: DUF302 domain-containing protein [Caulobacteraceae bacterium]|nr:DUF302 domain-containing protein [Caulobacteraceae bacterium]